MRGKTLIHDGTEYMVGLAFASEREAQRWPGYNMVLDGIHRGRVTPSRTGVFKDFCSYAPLHAKPLHFAERFDLYRNLASHTLLVHLTSDLVATVDSGVWRWHENGDEVQKEPGAETYMFWRPYCPVWDAPKPTAEENRQEAAQACFSDVCKVLTSYGCTFTNSGLYGGDANRIINGLGVGISVAAPGVAFAIDLTNCCKPEVE